MDKVIVYHNTEDDCLALMWPATNCGLTVEQIAAKDVPKGTKYKILNVSDLPTDLSFIDAWEYDFTNVTDTGTYDGK